MGSQEREGCVLEGQEYQESNIAECNPSNTVSGREELPLEKCLPATSFCRTDQCSVVNICDYQNNVDT
jgi:hypothetical protein